MHRDENVSATTSTAYWAVNLKALADHCYAYLGRDFDDYYFVRRIGDDYIIKRVITLDDSDMSERMRERFDAHDAWVDAVRNGDTDESYESRQNDIDIWEEEDCEDFHDCCQEIVDILHWLWLWSSDYSSSNWYYLDEFNTQTIDINMLDNLYNKLDKNDIFNEELWNDIEKTYWLHQIEFLAAEPIR